MGQNYQLGSVMRPLVSVVITAHNKAKYLEEAIQSVLAQTISDYEMIIVDDASTDETEQIVKKFLSYPNTRYVKNHTNKGQALSMMLGDEMARSGYIAWLDADDVWMNDRLESAVAFLESNPDIVCVGGLPEIFFDGAAVPASTYLYRTDPVSIKFMSLFKSELIVSSLTIRKSFIDLIDLTQYPAQDWGLASFAFDNFNIANLPRSNFKYRICEGQITANLLKNDTYDSRYAIFRKNLLNKIGIYPTDAEMTLHCAISPCTYWNIDEHPYFIFLVEQHPDFLNQGHLWVNGIRNGFIAHFKKSLGLDEIRTVDDCASMICSEISIAFNRVRGKAALLA